MNDKIINNPNSQFTNTKNDNENTVSRTEEGKNQIQTNNANFSEQSENAINLNEVNLN
jgi:hypothetical protein